MKEPGKRVAHITAVCLILSLPSCSHKFEPNVLDLDFYQWNLWYDTSEGSTIQGPSCGWDDLHRGKGKLVRIPALARDHFQDKHESGVLWYHCKFTLPENWEERKIELQITGAGPGFELFLNEDKIAEFQCGHEMFTMDVSEVIYYTRDNHLAIRITTTPGDLWAEEGIAGGVVIKSIPEEAISEE